MSSFLGLPRHGRAYVALVVAAGAVTIFLSLRALRAEPPVGLQWFTFAVLTLLTGSFTLKLPSVPVRISVSETFVFASVLLFGAAAGTLTVVLETLVISLWLKRDRRRTYRVAFNVSAPAIAIWVSGNSFFLLSGVRPYSVSPTPLSLLILPLVLFALLYFLLNSWLIAVALGIERRLSPLRIWKQDLFWLGLNYFGGASVATLLVSYSRDVDLGAIGIVAPLLLISYMTYRNAMARVEDSNVHLTRMNAMYLSTIETLAMAIDAKDQITHGHIRRVQSFAVGLAKRVGVGDDTLIKAIEAAALLHDMGKLAVPEYILNKPGKLTSAEFDKIKTHASIGADILSSIDFPYPVVPIVRHHHENWDGSGYPDGLRGTDIPIGARILSVVDCFDALTSDRPYRPRLPNGEALKVLLERRGTMYDPLIVDAFVNVHDEIGPEPVPSGPDSRLLKEITSSAQGPLQLAHPPRFEEIVASADEMLTLYELARAMAGQASVSDTGDMIAKHLRRLIPSSLCVFYLYDASKNQLEATHAVGDGVSLVKGLKIPLGQRLSGWVATNRQTIVNSDPTLDLGEVARTVAPRLRSCLSTVLVSGDMLVGVLTLYSLTVDGFTEDHRRIIEGVARQVAHTFKSAADFDSVSRRDPLTGLPNISQLERLVDTVGLGNSPNTSLLFIDVVGVGTICAIHGRPVGDDVLRHVALHAREGLRVADILFRCGSERFVALLNDTDLETTEAIARRIRSNIREHPFSIPNRTIPIDTRTTIVTAPLDGRSLRDLMTAAGTSCGSTPIDHPGSSVH